MSTVLTDTSQLVETILMELIPLGYKTSAIIYIMRTLTKEDEHYAKTSKSIKAKIKKNVRENSHKTT